MTERIRPIISPNHDVQPIEKTILVKTTFSYTPDYQINLQLRSMYRTQFQEADTVITPCSQRGKCPVYLRGKHNASPVSAVPDCCPAATLLTNGAVIPDSERFYDLEHRYGQVSCGPAGHDRFWMNIVGRFPDRSQS